jgi:hypothetical protein
MNIKLAKQMSAANQRGFDLCLNDLRYASA